MAAMAMPSEVKEKTIWRFLRKGEKNGLMTAMRKNGLKKSPKPSAVVRDENSDPVSLVSNASMETTGTNMNLLLDLNERDLEIGKGKAQPMNNVEKVFGWPLLVIQSREETENSWSCPIVPVVEATDAIAVSPKVTVQDSNVRPADATADAPAEGTALDQNGVVLPSTPNPTEADKLIDNELEEYLNQQSENGNSRDIPSDFCCPLSLEVMVDPVQIVASGQTYERAYIERWFQEGKNTCPTTMQTLESTDVVPNNTLKGYIARWAKKAGYPLPLQVHLPESCDGSEASNASSGMVRSTSQRGRRLSELLRLMEAQAPSLSAEFEALTPGSDGSKSAGSPLNSTSRWFSEDFEQHVDNSQSSLAVMTRQVSGDRSVTTELTGPVNLDLLLLDLKDGGVQEQRQAAVILRTLSKLSKEERLRIWRVRAIPPLVVLLSSDDEITVEQAVTTLLNLALEKELHVTMVEAGILQMLVRLLANGQQNCKENAAATVCCLTRTDEHRETLANLGAVPLLVELMANASGRGKKDAILALFNLGIKPSIKPIILEEGAVPALLEALKDANDAYEDEAVALLANLVKAPSAAELMHTDDLIPALVSVIEGGRSPKGRADAAATLLVLAQSGDEYRDLIWAECPILSIRSLQNTGTPRGKEKANQLLRILQPLATG